MIFRNILVVCVGNICRSPVAEALFRQALGEEYNISSAGFGALVGQSANKESKRWCCQQGIDLNAHIAKQLSTEHIQWADLILVMERSHRAEISKRYPLALGKIHLLGKWLDKDIPDPYGRSSEFFDDSLGLLQRGVEAWVARLPH